MLLSDNEEHTVSITKHEKSRIWGRDGKFVFMQVQLFEYMDLGVRENSGLQVMSAGHQCMGENQGFEGKWKGQEVEWEEVPNDKRKTEGWQRDQERVIVRMPKKEPNQERNGAFNSVAGH